MMACDVNCGIGCCGIEALDIHPQWIRVWLDDNSPELLEQARRQVAELISTLSDAPGEFYVLAFQDGGSSTYWVSMFTAWSAAIENAPTTPLPVPPQPETPEQRFRGQVQETLVLGGLGLLGAAPFVILIALVYWLFGLWR